MNISEMQLLAVNVTGYSDQSVFWKTIRNKT